MYSLFEILAGAAVELLIPLIPMRRIVSKSDDASRSAFANSHHRDFERRFDDPVYKREFAKIDGAKPQVKGREE
jgi:hypothetical protein